MYAESSCIYIKKNPLKGHYIKGQFFEFEAVTKNKKSYRKYGNCLFPYFL